MVKTGGLVFATAYPVGAGALAILRPVHQGEKMCFSRASILLPMSLRQLRTDLARVPAKATFTIQRCVSCQVPTRIERGCLQCVELMISFVRSMVPHVLPCKGALDREWCANLCSGPCVGAVKNLLACLPGRLGGL